MSLSQGFPNTFSATQQTQEVLKNHENEVKKIYTDINGLMGLSGHSHTGNGSDGAKLLSSSIVNTPAGNITSTDQQAVNAELDGRIGANPSYRNKLTNGNFNVWQRGTSFTIASGTSAYTADRYTIWNNTNQILTVIKDVVNGWNNSNLTPKMRLSFTIAPTSGSVIITQKVEGVETLAGKNTNLQFVHSTSETLTITPYLAQNFGTSGSSVVSAMFPTVASSLPVIRSTVSVSLLSILGKTTGANNYLECSLSIPIRSTNAFSLTQMQLEEGSVATQFEQRPIGLELSLCQRYTRRYSTNTVPLVDTALRATPTITGSSGNYLYESEL